MSKLETSDWQKFLLTDLFDMSNTQSIVQKNITPDSGKIPYVTASSFNNGVLTYIDCPSTWMDKGGCIMIGGKTLTFTFQENDFCSNDSHNIALYLKSKQHATKQVYLFLISALRSVLRQKYSWGDSISMKRIVDDEIYLPVDAMGQPDWAYMERYMTNVLEQSESNIDVLSSVIN
ncbi:restriction endonuclease subunit S [Actinomyces vulturis]|uniref:restriction endonuclease subunit S n=1 Tax=Actinomyces vulturis TaxID=1857645 RepID=UPI00082D9163|nr:restriction endonuclease subunit S [Actinomyces vulturis]